MVKEAGEVPGFLFIMALFPFIKDTSGRPHLQIPSYLRMNLEVTKKFSPWHMPSILLASELIMRQIFISHLLSVDI